MSLKITSPAGIPGYCASINTIVQESTLPTCWSPAPARTIRCPSGMPFSIKISCRVFSSTVFSPLHFLHLLIMSGHKCICIAERTGLSLLAYCLDRCTQCISFALCHTVKRQSQNKCAMECSKSSKASYLCLDKSPAFSFAVDAFLGFRATPGSRTELIEP